MLVTRNWFVHVMMSLGCATALPLLAAPSAVASLVEVVRSDGSGVVATAPGDLVTPDVPVGLPAQSGSVVLSIGEPDSPLDIGPIFADVELYASSLASVALGFDDADLVVMSGQSSAGSGHNDGLLGGARSAFPSNASLATGTLSGRAGSNTGTLEGNTSGGSGTVEGTIPGPSVISINGTISGPSPVPIPGAGVLFATGVAAMAGWLRRRRAGC